MQALSSFEDVSYTVIQLEAYDPSMRNSKSLCLMHNMTEQALAPLVRKVKRDKTISKTQVPTDHYPERFCEMAYVIIADAIRSQIGFVEVSC